VHTTNLPPIFHQLHCSLAVTTYQAGKLVLVRGDTEQEKPVINTHFRTFKKPMGMCVGDNRLALGTAQEIWEFRNVPAVTGKLEPAGKYDACFLPRRLHVTGDVQIHEMAYDRDELWFVNTAFSCLCTYDHDHSFVPRWRPKFVTALAPGDRCHLNGLEFVNGKPKYVTALGQTDTPGGWRENKKSGGLLIDLDSEEIISRGLSMPHSPRWYANRLWLLESGNGSFGSIDIATGRYEPIIQLPGFTRGLDFIGNLAFIGLSQVRETAVFSGISITERLTEADRNCGVWVVDIRSGQLVGFLRFEDAVQEIFAVSVLRGCTYPDLIHDDPKIIGGSYVLPDEALRDVPEAIMNPSEPDQSAGELASKTPSATS
jgi:uncharacterized protein (TIGR03032 family)